MDYRDNITRLQSDIHAEYVFNREFLQEITLRKEKYYALINEAKDSNDWISFENKMPKSDTPVLMKCVYMAEYITIGTLIYCDKTRDFYRGKSICDSDLFMRSGILAWKPLEIELDRWDKEIWNRLKNVTFIH